MHVDSWYKITLEASLMLKIQKKEPRDLKLEAEVRVSQKIKSD
jgi:hypothetical protein